MSPHDFTHEVSPHGDRRIRALLIGAGVILTGVGIAGIVLPLLPGMPFLILAAACFARSNRRLYNWLLNHRLVGPPLHAWRNHRRIPRWVKPRAVAAVILAFGLGAWFALEHPWARAAWLLFGAAVVVVIVRLPDYDASLAPMVNGSTRPSGKPAPAAERAG